MKAIADPAERARALEGLHTVHAAATAGKSIPLFDDLFRSGATMNAITGLLMGQGRAANVHVFAITRTRSNR